MFIPFDQFRSYFSTIKKDVQYLNKNDILLDIMCIFMDNISVSIFADMAERQTR